MLAAPVLALLTLGLAAGPASAAVATAPNPYASWSQRIPPQEWDGYFGSDCTIKAGPVWDTQNTGGQFAAIGGGTLYCQTLHTYTITVTEYFAHPGGYYSAQPGTRSYSATNYGTNGILQTGRLCGTGWWYTAVQVAAAGYTPALVFKSNPAYVAATLGC
jgi:hypothetical protein